MIHELRTYTLHPGKLPIYLNASATIGRPVRGDAYGVNHGYWTTEFGALNQIWHLWSYESLDERTRLRAELQKNTRWTTEYIPLIRPLLVRQDIRLLNPVKEITPPTESGGIYELRMYRTEVGQAGPWSKLFREIMPVREKYSKNVGIWTGEAPQPNEVLHMWNYPGVDARIATRAKVGADPEWQDFLKRGAGMVAEMQSILLLPTSYSVMR
jgi:hypothetical protein